jgi:hypothetical protein
MPFPALKRITFQNIHVFGCVLQYLPYYPHVQLSAALWSFGSAGTSVGDSLLGGLQRIAAILGPSGGHAYLWPAAGSVRGAGGKQVDAGGVAGVPREEAIASHPAAFLKQGDDSMGPVRRRWWTKSMRGNWRPRGTSASAAETGSAA